MAEGGKVCIQCYVWQPLDAFYVDPRTHDGRKGECASCVKARVHMDQPQPEDDGTIPLIDPADVPAPVLGGQCLASLRRTLAQWEADGTLVLDDADVQALTMLAQAVDVGSAQLMKGRCSPLSQARTADLYSNALERARKLIPERLEDDPITDLLRAIGQPTLGH